MNLMANSLTKLKCDLIGAMFIYLWVHWKSVVVITVPLIFLPLALSEGKEAQCGYVICVMAIYWMTEAIPLPVTSLIPVVALPLFGILSTDEVCLVYFKETNMMFLGGVIIAIAVEHCNLHKRVALKVLLMTGTSPQRLMFGFMTTTMFLSMWISNVAATAMMIPIVTAVLKELKSDKENVDNEKPAIIAELANVMTLVQECEKLDEGLRRKSVTKINISEINRPTNDDICYFLGVAYAANIGGTGTITGTSTNLTFKGILESIFPKAEGINFATWMQFNVPLMLFNTVLAWLWLRLFFMGSCRQKSKTLSASKEQEKHIQEVLMKSYEKLGPMSYHELSVLVLFLLDVVLWFFRKPEFITGWHAFFPDKSVASVLNMNFHSFKYYSMAVVYLTVKDSTAAIAIVLLLFILPANLGFLKCDKQAQKEAPALLNWKVLHEKFPFGIILLLGGGFAISKACEESGLSDYLGQHLEAVKDYPQLLILSVTCLAATFITEVSSNTAIANILLPVLAKMCVVLRINPLYLMVPTTVCCSFAFMLPVATPPNAIVMAASNMKSTVMMKAGFGMNLICVASLIVSFVLIGVPMYDLNNFPKWAENMTSQTLQQ